MSGIVGVYNRNQQNAVTQTIESMLESLQHRGGDGCGSWQSGPVAFGHTMLHTTNESVHESLPFYDAAHGLCITGDIRIDNRSELIDELRISQQKGHVLSDSQLFLKAYHQWKYQCFNRIIGDFSAAIWDSRSRQLVCVRDYIGIKPLYYHASEKIFILSNEIRPLIATNLFYCSPNEAVVAEYLTAQFVNKDETLIREIRRLPPAHYLVVTEDTIDLTRYWKPEPFCRLQYGREEDYFSHLRELFTKAVSARLRSHLPVCAELSGGMDSSFVVGTALSQMGETRDSFHVFSETFDGLTCDEQYYVKAFAKKHDLLVSYVDGGTFFPRDYENEVRQSLQPPAPPNLVNGAAIRKAMRDRGARVYLSGIGGDEWFSGESYPFWDLLRHQQYRELMRRANLTPLQLGNVPWRMLAADLCWPLIPKRIKHWLLRLRANRREYPDWLPHLFLEKTDIQRRKLSVDQRAENRYLSKTGMLNVFEDGEVPYVLEMNDIFSAQFSMEGRHPFLDKRVVEFALSLPEHLRMREGLSKYILRRAGERLLPEEIKSRRGKAEFSQLFYNQFSSADYLGKSKNMLIAQYGWLREKEYLEAVRENNRYFTDNPYDSYPDVWPLWYAFAVNQWCECFLKKE